MNECSTAIVEVMKSSFEMALGSGILRRCILGGWLPENFQESRFGSVLRYQKLCCQQKPAPEPQNDSMAGWGWRSRSRMITPDHFGDPINQSIELRVHKEKKTKETHQTLTASVPRQSSSNKHTSPAASQTHSPSPCYSSGTSMTSTPARTRSSKPPTPACHPCDTHSDPSPG